jgi:hypothetical protein
VRRCFELEPEIADQDDEADRDPRSERHSDGCFGHLPERLFFFQPEFGSTKLVNVSRSGDQYLDTMSGCDY